MIITTTRFTNHEMLSMKSSSQCTMKVLQFPCHLPSLQRRHAFNTCTRGNFCINASNILSSHNKFLPRFFFDETDLRYFFEILTGDY
uniref:Uncharacterized protein n=1 Tax=Pinctada fucata TaxID=50426 RepID=A0A194AMM2_PINFU